MCFIQVVQFVLTNLDRRDFIKKQQKKQLCNCCKTIQYDRFLPLVSHESKEAFQPSDTSQHKIIRNHFVFVSHRTKTE